MAEVNGAELMARSLKQQGVECMFGIVGFPVQPIATACQQVGIRFYGMRNEQAASYATQAAGYLLGRPQACLVVSGPGMIHAIAGLSNAWSNGWPMILIGGSSDSYQEGMGAFQEAPQVDAARLFSKYTARPSHVRRIPFYVEQAVRYALFGRPGAAYLDMPNDIILGTCDEEEVEQVSRVPEPPRTLADPASVEAALETLQKAERPLVIVGKGMAWARAENEVRDFIEKTQLPFLSTPMGAGVVPDDHPLSVAAARTYALQNADTVLLMGARLNWILHLGRSPRWAKDLKVIQMDIQPEEIGNNVAATVGLLGDGKAITRQLNVALEQRPWQFSAENLWRSGLQNKISENVSNTTPMLTSDDVPMGYYRVLNDLKSVMDKDTVMVAEGASTMDISRQVLSYCSPAQAPRCRFVWHHGRRPRLCRRRGGRQSGQARHRPAGRFGLRFQRHGGGNSLSLQSADHVRDRQQQRRWRWADGDGSQPADGEAGRLYGERALRQDGRGIRRRRLLLHDSGRGSAGTVEGGGVGQDGDRQHHDRYRGAPAPAAVRMAHELSL